ncbi:sugar ABC transporter permease [Clostridium sp. chh4-2]|uniref:carbohydrate ABC transporter permease n=1 Tax=Clostridium sp. chh4-2 TaxID=2067550 RepID=UPI000CCDDEBA|nr:sugar ABC transporter permease [Clostridium sp. chh4-2]PNV59574.1 sugar ABC transporter permease [Clostridium sp. chh4-2]
MNKQRSQTLPAPVSDRRRRQKRRINMWCWIFMIPTMVLYILFQGYPILSSIFYSTLDWSGMTSDALFVGLDNFKELLRDKYFFNSVINSFKYMIMAVPLQLTISLALAYIFNSIIKKGASFFRTVFFLPVITTASIVGIIMMFIFGGTGSVNQFLSLFGTRGINWLGNAKTALPVVVLIGVWKESGTFMIYWLAALQSVSQDVYEAATIDGANKWQTFRHVVFPLILPMGGVISVLCIISSLKVFDLIQTMTNGGPFYSTDVAATFVYRTAYASSTGMPRLGYASAAAMLFGLIVIAVGVIGNTAKTAFQKKNAV